jgi:hypothetical protein
MLAFAAEGVAVFQTGAIKYPVITLFDLIRRRRHDSSFIKHDP